MYNRHRRLAIGAALALLSATTGSAAERTEVGMLGNELTPVGALRAGNQAGTIPAWDGGLAEPLAQHEPGDRHIDAYADDEPRFVIGTESYPRFREHLTPGQIAMLERFPSYRMRVHPTRRSAAFPERIYKWTKRNADTARLVSAGNGVAQARVGFPFPIPDGPKELIWNHKLKYRGHSFVRHNHAAVVAPDGDYALVEIREEAYGPYWAPEPRFEDTEHALMLAYQWLQRPRRPIGTALMTHSTLDPAKRPRRVWLARPGEQPVRRAPGLRFAAPAPGSAGLASMDERDMFSGSLERFEWELVGKRALYVPYNAYRAHDSNLAVDRLIDPGHLDPEHLRYELHRVWVVDARRAPDSGHRDARRTYYLDEDSYQILMIDHFNADGELTRFSEAHPISYYEVPTFWSTLEVHYDLRTGRYICYGLDNQAAGPRINAELRQWQILPLRLRKQLPY